ncbi:E3 ubiquitin-protein ligase rnf8-A-like [Agrilus planipennis]|uniref:E3 ubiquitin-protein ligase rnf8-A-like n=1 Tax=Agrilus planipennis TaxID=224129 RepID=A0A1W4X9H1_AGRPL|nr:E3 ubiquitin-protein ligase rnf8-A-like [Agrilus planipennis]
METTDNVIQRMENDLLCPICQDYFKQAITLNCTHSFCYNCISNWRKTRNECPICRLHIAGLTASLALDNLVSAYTNQEKVKTQIIVEDNISRSDGWNSNGEVSYHNGNRNPMDTEGFEGEFEEEEESDSELAGTDSDFDGDMEEESIIDITENSDLGSDNISSEEEEEEDIFNSFESFSDINSSKSSSGSGTNSDSLEIRLSYNYGDGDVEEEEDDEDDDAYDLDVVSDDSI